MRCGAFDRETPPPFRRVLLSQPWFRPEPWLRNVLIGAGCLISSTISAQSIQQEAYLKASNPGNDDYFGYSVAISKDTLVVGCYQEDSAATGVNGAQSHPVALRSGAAYVFKRDESGNWTQQAFLKPSNTDAYDSFGYSVAISGDTIVVGAPEEDSSATGVNGNQADNSAASSGAAYVFKRESDGTWSQQAYLKAANSGATDWFGYSVGISGETIVVGSPLEDGGAQGVNGNPFNNDRLTSGAAYVFKRIGGTWSQEAYLKNNSASIQERFGASVAISEGTIVVAARYPDESGAGYVFARTAGGGWFLQSHLPVDDVIFGELYCCPVAISGGTIVVGDPFADDTAGAVHVFTRSGGTWKRQARLHASNAEVGDLFGSSVAISEDKIVAGACRERSSATGVNGDQADNSLVQAGAAYVFTRHGDGRWRQRGYVKASNTDAEDYFGGNSWRVIGSAHHESFSNAVAISGDLFAVGACWESSGVGATYVFDSDLGTDLPIGTVEAIYGSPVVIRRGVSTPVLPGDPVFAGDVVETGPADAIDLVLSDETRFSISENSHFAIEEFYYQPEIGVNRSRFNLLRGLFEYTSGLIGANNHDDVEFRTPVGGPGIRGTEFSLEVLEFGEMTHLALSVSSGAVEFTNWWSGEVSEVGAGAELQAEAPTPGPQSVIPLRQVIPANGGSYDFEVTSPGSLWSWDVTEGEEWLSSEHPADWAGNGVFTFQVAPNNGPEPRNATITLISGASTATHIVHQAGSSGDVAGPELVIETPEAGAVVPPGTSVRVEAVVRDNAGMMEIAEVRLNGAPDVFTELTPPVSGEARIDLLVEPSPGTNTLSITAYDTSGNPVTAERVFTVGVEPPMPAVAQLQKPRAFPVTMVGKRSRFQSLRVRNVGGSPLTGLRAKSGGRDRRDFLIVQPRRRTLIPGAAVAIKAAFRPRAAGIRKAVLEVRSNASPEKVPLSGRAQPKR